MKKCETCVYYDNGTCRRFPPTPSSFEAIDRYSHKYWDFNSMWTNVNKDDWCGEYVAKERTIDE